MGTTAPVKRSLDVPIIEPAKEPKRLPQPIPAPTFAPKVKTPERIPVKENR